MFGEMLVAGLLVVVVLKSWLVSFLLFDVFGVVFLGGSKNNNGAADFVSRGVETRTSFEGGVPPKNNGLQFLSLGCGRGSK